MTRIFNSDYRDRCRSDRPDPYPVHRRYPGLPQKIIKHPRFGPIDKMIPPQLIIYPPLSALVRTLNKTAQPCRTGNTPRQKFTSFHPKILLSKREYNLFFDKPDPTLNLNIKRTFFILQNKNGPAMPHRHDTQFFPAFQDAACP